MNTEQSIIANLLSQLAGLLGPLSPFTKAVVPAALAVVIAAVNSAFAGSIDTVSLTIAGTGLAAALLTFLVPNKPKVVKPPFPVQRPIGK
jgi:hypothetical protein